MPERGSPVRKIGAVERDVVDRGLVGDVPVDLDAVAQRDGQHASDGLDARSA